MKMSHIEVTEDPNNDTVIMRTHLKWSHDVATVTQAENGIALGTIMRRADGAWELVFSIQRGLKFRQRHFVEVSVSVVRNDRWMLLKLAPGVWDIPQSIHVPGQYHGFVTLLNVPVPAPWEVG